jgi:hypothetical protein
MRPGLLRLVLGYESRNIQGSRYGSFIEAIKSEAIEAGAMMLGLLTLGVSRLRLELLRLGLWQFMQELLRL